LTARTRRLERFGPKSVRSAPVVTAQFSACILEFTWTTVRLFKKDSRRIE
jgi:hypothetical protein